MEEQFLFYMLSNMNWQIECECCGSCYNNTRENFSSGDIIELQRERLSHRSKVISKPKNEAIGFNPIQPAQKINDTKLPTPKKSKKEINQKCKKENSSKASNAAPIESKKTGFVWDSNMDFNLLQLAGEYALDWDRISLIMNRSAAELQNR